MELTSFAQALYAIRMCLVIKETSRVYQISVDYAHTGPMRQ